MTTYLFSFLTIGFALGQTLYKDCGSINGKVRSVNVEGCSSGPICILKSGTNVTLNVEFEALTDTNKLTSVVHGIIGGIPLPFLLPNDNGCISSGIKCPVVNEETYHYESDLEILQIYPKIRVIVKWELKDETGKDMFCILIPAAIQ
ncbi:NPC intracellular cholesterol transporter 2 homolog a-like [Artemia franciscana]|uniref:MD-2-related lipid-recognition domain-containing protein n=1 Tax=Artemia franciscana TaxID=6661 RepID=A0AA88HEF3_ARTSF|nr:hypothetical protein QYM36_015297 [Artemia franciscana]